MRLSILDRILLFLSTIFMLAIGVGIAMVCTSATSFSEMAKYAEAELSNPTGVLILVVCAAVIILVAVKLLLSLFISPKEKKPSELTEKIILQKGEDGNIMVSSDLVKDIAVRYAKTADDVKDVDCKVLPGENGVSVLMKFYLKRDIVINDFLAKMQTELKDYVEKHSGVVVTNIDLCADVYSGNGRYR